MADGKLGYFSRTVKNYVVKLVAFRNHPDDISLGKHLADLHYRERWIQALEEITQIQLLGLVASSTFLLVFA